VNSIRKLREFICIPPRYTTVMRKQSGTPKLHASRVFVS